MKESKSSQKRQVVQRKNAKQLATVSEICPSAILDNITELGLKRKLMFYENFEISEFYQFSIIRDAKEH